MKSVDEIQAEPLAPVHESVRVSAKRHGARAALVGDQTVRYFELEARASALAGNFRGARVAVGDRVAIWATKSTAYATCIVATLQAGAVYVPLDGGQPVERAIAILRDAEPAVLVVDRAHHEQLAKAALPRSVREILVVDGAERVTREDGVHVRPLLDWLAPRVPTVALPEVGLRDLAAILYTSGSTGVPKGVCISHRNLANFVAWARAEMKLDFTDVFANHASFNFDLSTFDLFAGLASGGAVWIIPDDEVRNVSALANGLREHRVTVWYSVPSILAMLVGSGALDASAARELRYVLFAGEVFPIQRLRELAAVLPETCVLYNWYGPTETNVCTFHRVGDVSARRTPVPIGTAITGATLVVVDEDGRDVTGTGSGELLVRGPCVTPGYWRREDPRNGEHHLTGTHATGDLVSYEDGQLVYRGRKDRMVKISGYRVELGEIEAAVLRHPRVREAAVIAVTRDDGVRIVAFCAAVAGEELSLFDVKAHCGQLLPRYMVPHALTRLDALPKNANGKVDYVALAHRAAGRAPSSSVEQQQVDHG